MCHKSFCQYVPSSGAELFTVVCLPSAEGKYPTVIYRSPYVDAEEKMSEEEVCAHREAEFSYFLDAGYAVVLQHCRGRGKSSGDCVPYIYEREDGLGLQAWIREQSFYNGELYLCGTSYTSSVHYVTAPFAPDIKGAILGVQDTERYNCNYRNGIYKVGLHGNWYVSMYKQKTMPKKDYTEDSYRMLPLSDFSQAVFGERVESFDEVFRHPDRDDPFWSTHMGGGEAVGALSHARIPILMFTAFYDIYTGGIFDMWRKLDDETRAMSAMAVHPFGHFGHSDGEPIAFENGKLSAAFGNYKVQWLDAIRGKGEAPFQKGLVTYYKLFANTWCCDGFDGVTETRRVPIGKDCVTYTYNPYAPVHFRGGLSTNFGGNEWQPSQSRRYDVITRYTEEFTEDTFIKGRMRARLRVRSDCEDTCFYMRLSLCKAEGDYGLRDDIQQISNVNATYRPGEELELELVFDEHAFVVKKGERLRMDITSSAYPFYVPHTNQRGLFSEQTTARVAHNTVDLAASYLELPIG